MTFLLEFIELTVKCVTNMAFGEEIFKTPPIRANKLETRYFIKIIITETE